MSQDVIMYLVSFVPKELLTGLFRSCIFPLLYSHNRVLSSNKICQEEIHYGAVMNALQPTQNEESELYCQSFICARKLKIYLLFPTQVHSRPAFGTFHPKRELPLQSSNIFQTSLQNFSHIVLFNKAFVSLIISICCCLQHQALITFPPHAISLAIV